MLSLIQNINSYLEGSWPGAPGESPSVTPPGGSGAGGEYNFLFSQKKGIFLIKFVSINWLNVLCIVKSII